MLCRSLSADAVQLSLENAAVSRGNSLDSPGEQALIAFAGDNAIRHESRLWSSAPFAVIHPLRIPAVVASQGAFISTVESGSTSFQGDSCHGVAADALGVGATETLGRTPISGAAATADADGADWPAAVLPAEPLV